jgi:dUTPase
LSQKATVWQKLKWLFSSGVEIVEVESLSGTNRNGFGSTGVN